MPPLEYLIMKYGFEDEVWESAKSEAKQLLTERAKVRGMMSYSELVARMKTIKFESHDRKLFKFLGEISSEEDRAGNGMLTVIVVHKRGDMQPGPGFFELAQELGRNTSDILKCWVEELHKVHAIWGK
jgi:hypothetical protein